ncbi:MAG: response regulator [Candidatus Zixiibacteriota bacterium]
MEYSKFSNKKEIRSKAEDIFHKKNQEDLHIDGDIESVLQELRIHQIELKLQNQELLDAQEELEKTHEQYSDLYELAPVGYLTLDNTGRIKKLNLTAIAFLGNNRNYWFNRDIHDIITPKHHRIFDKHLRDAIIKHKRTFCEVEIMQNGGKWFRINSVAENRYDDVFCRSAFIDITEQKKANIALKDSEERLKLALECANEALWDWDFRNDTMLLMGFWNRFESRKRIASPRESWWFKSMHPEDKSRFKNLFEAHIEGLTDMFECEYRLKDKNDEFRWVLVKGRIIERSHSGSALRAVGTLVEITKQKRIQKRLANAEKLESLGRLAGGVAHDLNNILVGMIGYPELLLKKLKKDDPLRKYVLKIQQSSFRARDTVEDILTLARRGLLAKEPIDINKIVRKYIESPELQTLAKKYQRISISYNLADYPLIIDVAENHIFKSIMNLVSNAAEAIHNEGKITITTKKVILKKPIEGYMNIPAGKYAFISVKDTGIGIPEEDIDLIFDPFFTKKLDNSRGTGLGLSIIWGTLIDHFSFLDIETKANEGTDFKLYIPLLDSRPLFYKKEDKLVGLLGSHEKVLLVDDRMDQRDIASSILESLNYEVDTAESGEEALEILEKQNYDIVLLDMIMQPGIDGLETYQKIIAKKPDQKTMIITGYAENDRLEDARKLGIRSFIRKPYILSELARKIKKELS